MRRRILDRDSLIEDVTVISYHTLNHLRASFLLPLHSSPIMTVTICKLKLTQVNGPTIFIRFIRFSPMQSNTAGGLRKDLDLQNPIYIATKPPASLIHYGKMPFQLKERERERERDWSGMTQSGGAPRRGQPGSWRSCSLHCSLGWQSCSRSSPLSSWLSLYRLSRRRRRREETCLRLHLGLRSSGRSALTTSRCAEQRFDIVVMYRWRKRTLDAM